jgi:hypothetical protein
MLKHVNPFRRHKTFFSRCRRIPSPIPDNLYLSTILLIAAVYMKIALFWYVKSYSLADCYWCFRETFWLQFHDIRILLESFTCKMEAEDSFKTSVTINVTRRHITEERNFLSFRFRRYFSDLKIQHVSQYKLSLINGKGLTRNRKLKSIN